MTPDSFDGVPDAQLPYGYWRNLDGDLVLAHTAPTLGSCVICGGSCGITIRGIWMHGPCWRTIHTPDWMPAADAPATPQPATAAPPPATPAAATEAEPRRRQRPAAKAQQDRSQPAAARPQQSAVPPRPSEFAGPAAVVDTSGVFIGTAHIPLPDPLTLPGLFDLTSTSWKVGHRLDSGQLEMPQLWLSETVMEQLGIGLPEIEDTTDVGRRAYEKLVNELVDQDAIRQLHGAGWAMYGDRMRGWSSWQHTDGRRVRLVLIPATELNADRLLFDQHTDDALPYPVIAEALALVAAVTGLTWRASNVSTSRMIMTSVRRTGPDPFIPAKSPSIAEAQHELEFRWNRMPTEQERTMRYLHAYDRNGAYLAVAGSIPLGVGEPTHHDTGASFDKRTCGLWRIDATDGDDWRLPSPVRGRNAGHTPQEHTIWVTTPTLAYAHEIGLDPVIHEAWVWDRSERVLEPWYKRLRDARTALIEGTYPASPQATDAVKATVKELYTHTIGLFGSANYGAEGKFHRPVWRQAIIAQSRANMLRKIRTIGETTNVWPIGVWIDAILYASDDPDPITAWPGKPTDLGTGLGQLKHEGTALMADQVTHLSTPNAEKPKLTREVPNA